MAEKPAPKVYTANNSDTIDCAVCLQQCVYPTVLPCGHVFCFLCIKGLGRTTKTCAMCRKEFSIDLLENPTLLHPIDYSTEQGFDDGQQWFYEGRNGWWQYDERTSRDIEQSYKQGVSTCEVSIAGKMYVIDFSEMEQRQKQNVLKSRRIKRDASTIPKKGISGIRTTAVRSHPSNDLEARLASLDLTTDTSDE